ncbi:hypothetical protein D3C71_1660880 [compost metagenome]
MNEEGLKKAALQLPQTRSVDELFKLARNLPDKKLSSWICLALKGGFTGSADATELWRNHIYNSRRKRPDSMDTPRWLKNAFGLSLFVLAFTIYWVFRF